MASNIYILDDQYVSLNEKTNVLNINLSSITTNKNSLYRQKEGNEATATTQSWSYEAATTQSWSCETGKNTLITADQDFSNSHEYFSGFKSRIITIVNTAKLNSSTDILS